MKHTVKLALIATCGVLWGAHTHGQSAATNTNGALVIQAANTATTTPAIEISPEVREEMLKAAADEIGHPAPNDLDDLFARHGAMKEKMLAIEHRHASAGTNAPAAPVPAPVNSPKSALLKAKQPLPTEQLDQVINQLSEIRSQMTETP